MQTCPTWRTRLPTSNTLLLLRFVRRASPQKGFARGHRHSRKSTSTLIIFGVSLRCNSIRCYSNTPKLKLLRASRSFYLPCSFILSSTTSPRIPFICEIIRLVNTSLFGFDTHRPVTTVDNRIIFIVIHIYLVRLKRGQ